MRVIESVVTVFDTIFEHNTSSNSGGGVSHLRRADTEYFNCIFYGNSVSEGPGGALLSEASTTTATNCTFYGNSALNAGALYSKTFEGIEDNSSVVNSILWGDSPDEVDWNYNEPEVIFSNVEGGYKGEGNIDSDPLFVDPVNGDFHLESGSLCIDVASAKYAPETDFDGNPRDEDPDMGAYEVQ